MAEKNTNQTKPERGEYRSIYVALLHDENYLALSVEAKNILLTLKMSLGASGIGVMYPGQLEYHTGLTPDKVQSCLAECEECGWITRSGILIWLIEGLRWEPNLNLRNPNHRSSIESHLKGLPKSQLVNDMAHFYGIPLPFPKLGISGRFIPEETIEETITDTIADTTPKAVKTDSEEWNPFRVATACAPYLQIDGQYPTGYTKERDMSIAKAMLAAGYEGQTIVEAAEGLALMRDAGKMKDIEKGDAMTLRLLWVEGTGVSDLFTEARDYRVRHYQVNAGKKISSLTSRIGKSEAA